MNHLFIVTTGFPHDNAEPYLEDELSIINNYFDKISIICPAQFKGSDFTSPVAQNIEINYLEIPRAGLIRLLIGLFNCLFIKEVFLEIFQNAGSIQKLKIAIKDLADAIRFKYAIENSGLVTSTATNYIYTYWCDWKTVGMALLKRENPNVLCSTRLHGWDLYFERNLAGYLPFRPLLINTLDNIFFISQIGKKYFERKLNATESRNLQLAPLGCKPSKFKEFIHKDTLVIYTISYLYPLKRINLLIDSLVLINGFKVIWHHIGEGNDTYGIKEKAFRELKNANISFKFHGNMKHTDVNVFLDREPIDLIINLSTDEGLPVSIMEAFSRGIPAIATAVGGTPEIVNNNNGTLLSPNPTPGEVANAIAAYYYLSDDLKIKKKNAAYHTWDERYNAVKNFKAFADMILYKRF